MWSNKYLGIPYKTHGRDLEGIDCWGLVRLIYKNEYNIDLPSFSEHYLEDDRARSEELINLYKEGWEQTPHATEGAVVVLKVLGHLSHVGVCIDSTQFIHAQEGSGSSVQSFDSIKWANRVAGFFKYKENAGTILNAVPHPLKTERVTTLLTPGTTLEELYSKITLEYGLADSLKKNAHIFVNGVLVPRISWNSTVLKATDVVEYRAVPDKDAARMVAFVALAVFAPQAIAALQGAILGGTSVGMALGSTVAGSMLVTAVSTAAVYLAGSALINAIFPIRPPGQNDPGSSERQLMVQGGQNPLSRYGAIPVVLGKVRLTPPLGASTFVTFEDDASGKNISYLNMMLAWGYGPLSIDESSMQIGPTSWSNYDDVQRVTVSYQTSPTQQQKSDFNRIIASDVNQRFSGVELVSANYAGITQVVDGKTVPVEVNQTQWNTSYNNGNYYMRKTNPSGGFVDNVFYSTWSPNTEVINWTDGYGAEGGSSYTDTWVQQTSPVFQQKTSGWIESTFNTSIQKAVVAISFPQGLRLIKIGGKDAGKTFTATVEFQLQYRYKINANTWQTTWTSLPNLVITKNEKDGFTNTTEYPVDPTYPGVEFRIRRITSDNSEPNDNDRMSWTSTLHSVTGYFTDPNYQPVDWAPLNCTVAKSAIKIKATDQLNGNIDGISAIVQSICKIWTGGTNFTTGTLVSNWSTVAPTSNPAALFLHVLTHPSNPQKITTAELSSRVDLARLAYWYNYCQNYQVLTSGGPISKSLQFNGVVATQRSVLEILRDICAAGRASPALRDGKWTVTIDEPQNIVVQHFTPHNSWNFESVKALPKYPHALKIQFYDEDKNYQENEIIVPASGYTTETAELFEVINLPGVTNSVIAEDFARWHFAQVKLRPEVFSIDTDIEYLVCNRGDRVKILHDVPMWGLQSGRIKNRLSTTVLELDEELPVIENKTYTIRFRGVSNTGVGTNQVLDTERQLKTSFNATSYGASTTGNVVTLVLGEHPLKVGNRVAVTSSVAGVVSTNALITEVTSNSITYTSQNNIGFVASGTPIVATVRLKDGYYSTIQLTSAVTQYEAANNDLFMFGELQQETQDLIVIGIEPTSGAKNARLTLVDYGVRGSISGVTAGYNIFTEYFNYTGLTYFSNITNTPEVYIDDIGLKVPTIMANRIVSDESVMTKTSTGTFAFAIRVPYEADLTLPPTVTHVEGQIDTGVDLNSSYKSVIVELDKSSVLFQEVEEDVTYRVRLRYVDKDGRTGKWTNWVTHKVSGRRTPPSSVANFTYKITEAGIVFTWSNSTVPDYAYSVIKVGNSWSDPNAKVLYVGNTNSWLWTRPLSGTYNVFIKHVDNAGIESSTASSILNLQYFSVDLGSIQVAVTNDNHQVPCDISGNNPIFTGSGTNIYVYEYGTRLDYSTTATANGTWKVNTKVDVGLTSGSITAGANNQFATLSNLTAFSDPRKGTVTFNITGKTLSGESFSVQGIQNITKVYNGNGVKTITSSTPVVYKDAINSTTAGTFSTITVSGGITNTSGSTSLYGWIGVVPYKLVGGIPTAQPEQFVFRQFTSTPANSDESVKWVVRLYDYDSTTFNGSTITQPPVGTAIVDTEEIQVVFKGITGAAGVDALNLVYTNDSLTVPVSNTGTPTWTSSGGLLQVYDGSSLLTLEISSQSTATPTTNGRFRLDIVPVSGNTLTEPTISGTNTTTATLGDWAGSLTTATVYRVTAYVKRINGLTTTISKDITISPSQAGADSTVYYIDLTSPVIYKQAPDAATSGTHQSIVAQGKRVVGSTITNYGWLTITPNGGTESGTAINTASSGLSLAPANGDGKTTYTVKMYNQATVSGATLLDTQVVPVVFRGSTGADGVDPVVIDLSNDNATIATNTDGSGGTYTTAISTVSVFKGLTSIINLCTFTLTPSTGVTYSYTRNGSTTSNITTTSNIAAGTTSLSIAITGLTNDNGTITVQATYNSQNYSVVFTVSKAKQGVSTIVYEVEPSGAFAVNINTNTISPTSISYSAFQTSGASPRTAYGSGSIRLLKSVDGATWTEISTTNGSSASLANSSLASTDRFVRAVLYSGTNATGTLVDQETSPISVSGSNGGAGTPGNLTAKIYAETINSTTAPTAYTGSPPTVNTGTWKKDPITTFSGTNTTQWESDGVGTWNSGSYTWSWSVPYLSYFKVNTLEAITTQTGNLVIGTNGSIRTQGTAFGQTGVFLGYDQNAYKFSVGQSGDNPRVSFDGTTLTVPVFSSIYKWDFTNKYGASSTANLLGWLMSQVTPTYNIDSIRITSTGSDPIIRTDNNNGTKNLNFLGRQYTKVLARVKRISGTGWEGICFYSTTSRTFESSNHYKAIPDKTILNEWVVLEWDMSTLTAGGTDWINSTIRSIRLDFGAGAFDVFDIDWIAIGKYSSGPIDNITANNSDLVLDAGAVITRNLGIEAATLTRTTTSTTSFSSTGTLQQILTFSFNMPEGGQIIALWQCSADSARNYRFTMYLNSDPSNVVPAGYRFVGYGNGNYEYDTEYGTGYYFVGTGNGSYNYIAASGSAEIIGTVRTGGAFEDAPFILGIGNAIAGTNTIKVYWEFGSGSILGGTSSNPGQKLVVLGAKR